MTEDYEFSCWLRVSEPEALYAAALARAEADGLSRAYAERALRNQEGVNVSSCLTMLLDPGQPPPGCEILSSDTMQWDSFG
jgi:hypothetical protein